MEKNKALYKAAKCICEDIASDTIVIKIYLLCLFIKNIENAQNAIIKKGNPYNGFQKEKILVSVYEEVINIKTAIRPATGLHILEPTK